MAKRQVGTIACICCRHDVPVKTATGNPAETLSFSCPWCDFPGYAKAGTRAHEIVSKVVRWDAPVKGSQKPAQNPPQEPPAPPPPARAAAGSMFHDLGGRL